MCSSFINGSPKSSSFKKNSNKGFSSISPSSVPNLLHIDPDALFLITHSIGNISNFFTREYALEDDKQIPLSQLDSDYLEKKIVQIEESILNNISIVLNKKIELSIYNECRKKKYLLENNQCNLILRISGIWESYDKIGITYKFILQ